MAHTSQDEKSIIARQKLDIDILNQKLNQEISRQDTRDRGLSHVRVAMDEAVAMAERWQAIPVAAGDKQATRRRSEATRLAAYFRECKRSFDDELGGKITAIAEKVVIDADNSST